MLAFSQAAENNKTPILEQLQTVFAESRKVLEIGSGTGQHAVYFSAALPHLTWQCSDLAENLPDLQARLKQEGEGRLSNPLHLDVMQKDWPLDSCDGVFSANAVHIMSWAHVEAFFAGVGRVLVPGGRLVLYGPFRYGGDFTTDSNARFDLWLKERNPLSGIRDFEAIDALATAQGLQLIRDQAMPANNQLLVWEAHS